MKIETHKYAPKRFAVVLSDSYDASITSVRRVMADDEEAAVLAAKKEWYADQTGDLDVEDLKKYPFYPGDYNVIAVVETVITPPNTGNLVSDEVSRRADAWNDRIAVMPADQVEILFGQTGRRVPAAGNTLLDMREALRQEHPDDLDNYAKALTANDGQADRLNAPTVITAPGDYITRNGTRVTIDRIDNGSVPYTFPCKGSAWKMFRGAMRPRGFNVWMRSGHLNAVGDHPLDIVGPWE